MIFKEISKYFFLLRHMVFVTVVHYKFEVFIITNEQNNVCVRRILMNNR